MRSTPVPAGSIGHARLLLAAVASILAVLTWASLASAAAPPGRAYERVTPAEKGGADVIAGYSPAPAGGGIGFTAFGGMADTQGIALYAQYAGIRGSAGWTVVPHNIAHLGNAGFNSAMPPGVFSDDMQYNLLLGAGQGVPGDIDGVGADLYRVGPNSEVDMATQGPLIGLPDDRSGTVAAGAISADGGHVAFDTDIPLTAGATAGQMNVYDRTGGQTFLVGIDENGTPLPTARLGEGRASTQPLAEFQEPSSMSRDGNRIFFSTQLPEDQLYVRENNTSTTHISLSQATGSVGDPAPDSDYQMATPDGGQVFFISSGQLTDDATPSGGLYRYDTNTDELDYVSAGSTDPAGARVLGAVRTSADGSRVYFVANDDLGGEGTEGSPNLYLAEPGGVRFVATLGGSFEDAQVYSGGEGIRLAKGTPSASHLLFVSVAQLTTYDNAGVLQVYLYDADADEMTCVSCPDGPAVGPASLNELGGFVSFEQIPGDVSTDGSAALFSSTDPLVPEDTNNVPDAYLWQDGEVYVLGNGTQPASALPAGMSDDGGDVFFLSRDALVPADQDGGIYDMYDARVGGGLADQQVPPGPCLGEGCRPTAPPRVTFDPPGTIDFDGPGDVDEAGFSVGAIGAKARRSFANGGRLTVRVLVTDPGRVSARALSGGDTVASASRRASGAGTVRLQLRLSQAARRKLERTGRLRVTLRVSYSEVARTSTARFTLRSGGGR